MAKITIKGLTRLQANAIAILFEDGLEDRLNEIIHKKFGAEVESLDMPILQMDDDKFDPEHEINFGY